jgi:hypothetical protein
MLVEGHIGNNSGTYYIDCGEKPIIYGENTGISIF